MGNPLPYFFPDQTFWELMWDLRTSVVTTVLLLALKRTCHILMWNLQQVLFFCFMCVKRSCLSFLYFRPIIGFFCMISGKVLRGRARVQVNAQLGQPWMPPLRQGGPRMPPSIVPMVWYEDSAEMTATQAATMKDKLRQIHLVKLLQVYMIIFFTRCRTLYFYHVSCL